MLRLSDPQIHLWDGVLPPEACRLPAELEDVDRWLADERLLAPYRERFGTRTGRPTVPVETYLRLMYLKFRYQLGYESLVREVRDSLSWRRFCRIALDERIPHATTLIKLSRKYGPETIEELNRLLLQKALERKVLRGRKLRVDTTVLTADIHHPTDAGLLADGVRCLTRTVKRLQQAGAAVRTGFRDRTRSVRYRLFELTKVLRRRTGEARADVERITAEVMGIARHTVREAGRVLTNGLHYVWRKRDEVPARTRRIVARLRRVIELTERVIRQTGRRLEGVYPPDRLVSLYDPDARPIRKGKLSSPTEFGYKLFLQETEERLITGYRTFRGNPPDVNMLLPAIERHAADFGRPPRAVATDRGFGSRSNETALRDLGVRKVSLPLPGKRSGERRRVERQPWFRRLQRWRAGGEATISLLKRKYGLARSRFRGLAGAETWVGFGILTYNLHRLATMT